MFKPLSLAILFATASEQTEVTIRDTSKKWLNATATIPKFDRSILGQFASAEITRIQRAALSRFVKEFRNADKSMSANLLDHLYYDASARITNEGSNLITVQIITLTYTGGAHGNSTNRILHFALRNGKPNQATTWDLLKRSMRQELQIRLLGAAMRDSRTQWIDEGIVTEFTDAQLGRFTYSDAAFMWHFDPYELGPYAVGPITLMLPTKDVKDLLRSDGPLSWLK